MPNKEYIATRLRPTRARQLSITSQPKATYNKQRMRALDSLVDKLISNESYTITDQYISALSNRRFSADELKMYICKYRSTRVPDTLHLRAKSQAVFRHTNNMHNHDALNTMNTEEQKAAIYLSIAVCLGSKGCGSISEGLLDSVVDSVIKRIKIQKATARGDTLNPVSEPVSNIMDHAYTCGTSQLVPSLDI
jgi:hypothetical protein